MLRQFISFGTEAGFHKLNMPLGLKAMIGTLSGTGVALIAHAIGVWRDEKAGSATPVSRRSRAIMASTVLAAGIGELSTSTAASNASTHIAFTIYTGMRDIMVQSRVRLHNPNTTGIKPDWIHFSIMMILYGIDQGLVNLSMSKLASPSGQAAWAAGSRFVEQLKHAVIRGCLNWLGEIGEDFLFQVIPSVRSQINGGKDTHVLQLSLKDVGYQKGYLANAILGPWAVRTGILATTTALLSITAPYLANNMVLSEAISDLIVGVTNGLLYEPFANSGSGQPSPTRTVYSGNEESLRVCDQSNDAVSIRSYTHPNVDMTNSTAIRRQAASLGHHQLDASVTKFTGSSHGELSIVQSQRMDLPSADDYVLFQPSTSSSSTSICPCNLQKFPLESDKNTFCTHTPQLIFCGTLMGKTVQSEDTQNTTNSWNEKCAAFEEQSEYEQLRAAAGSIATIDLAALRRNFRLGMAMLATPIPDIDNAGTSACIPRQARASAVVKANAYGLGTGVISRTLVSEGCRDFFVARISEAVELRKMLQAWRPDRVNEVAINVFDGNLAGADPRLLIKYKITPVLNSLEQVREWNLAGEVVGYKLPAVLQFDSGMSRAGMNQRDMEQLLSKIKAGMLGNIDIKMVMTHLAKASDVLLTTGAGLDLNQLQKRQPGITTQRQLAIFENICQHFPDAGHSIGASSTVFLSKTLHKDMVRMGGIFHGQAPFDADSNPLEQVMTLKSKIMQISDYKKGAEVGYGGKFTLRKDMKLATIPIGYADGLPRRENANEEDKPRPYVLVAGKYKCEFVGANSMDVSSIDVTNVPLDVLHVGVSVTLIGDGITADHLGNMFNTNASEMQTKLASRVFRIYLDEDPPLPFVEPDPGPSPYVWGSFIG